MESFLTLLATVLAIHFLAVASPGPDFLVVLKNSLSRSRKDGVMTALGVALGISIHVFYCVAGLALIISQSIIAFDIIKTLGACYLLFLGGKVFYPKSAQSSKSSLVEKTAAKKTRAIPSTASPIDYRKSFVQGFVTNVFNPKATLFFLSLFTFVISPTVPKSWLAIFGVFMICNTFFWFAFVACVMTLKPVRNVYERFAKWIDYVCGAFFIALGIKLLTAKR